MDQVTAVTKKFCSETHLRELVTVVSAAGTGLEFVRELGFFDRHVLELARLENLAAFEAFHKFGVFFTSNNLDTGMLTYRHIASHRGVRGGGIEIHKSGGDPFELSWVESPELRIL